MHLVSGDKEIHEKSHEAESVKLDREKDPAAIIGETESATPEEVTVTGESLESLYKSPGRQGRLPPALRGEGVRGGEKKMG